MKQVLAHIDEELYREFKIICAEKDIRIGKTLERLIKNFVEKERDVNFLDTI